MIRTQKDGGNLGLKIFLRGNAGYALLSFFSIIYITHFFEQEKIEIMRNLKRGG